jgi:PAS domain S-box-containing protein
VQPESPAEEIKHLRHCINDLVSVVALPALWTGGEPTQIVQTLLDTLLGMLGLDFLYVRLKDPVAKMAVDMIRVAQSAKPILSPQTICKALDHLLGDDPRKWPSLVRNLIGDGDVSIVPLQLGLHGELGVMVAGSQREDFPRQTEQLLLSVAANQAAIGLQEARLLSEQKRVAGELDQEVAQRTIELAKANEELQRSEAFLVEGQSLSHTGSFGWSVPSGEIYWSVETYNIFEQDRASKPTLAMILGRVHPDDRDPVQHALDRAIEARADFDLEHRLLMPDGSVKHLHVLARALTTCSGHLEFVGAVTDVTAAKLAVEALRASERSFRLIVDSIPGLTCTMTAEGEVELVNQRILDYTGKTPEELRNWAPLIHPDDRTNAVRHWSRAVETGEPYDSQHRVLRSDGEYRWFQVRGLPLRSKEGRIVRWYILLTDIEERKKAEENLRSSEADLLEAQHLAHIGTWKHDIPTGTVIVSPEIFRGYDIQPYEDTSDPALWFRRIHPDDRARVSELFEKSEREKIDYSADYRIVLPDGTVKYQHSSGRPVLNESGDLVQFIGTTMEVTEQVQARIALEQAFEEIKRLKDRLHEENVALREEIDRSSMFEEIVGSSKPIRQVLKQVEKVAASDSTVLILGETGTGKELIARALHKRSKRATRAFIRVSCAAIPQALIASELFGHEKGAFTGALQRRLGRFETADGGTLFLDEIGDLPMETQISLLRVLQEREFERVGSNQPVKVDVRLIAATNRDLQSAVAAGSFRQDLFYRLNVFPIEVPPLRERVEDIPLLVEYFVGRYANAAGKNIRQIGHATLEALRAYQWPGNIRELQNVVERAVILSEGDTFVVDESWLEREPADSPRPREGLSGPADRELEMIEAALAESRGRIGGPSGAAKKLGIPRQTLESKIQRLGIDKYRHKRPSSN